MSRMKRNLMMMGIAAHIVRTTLKENKRRARLEIMKKRRMKMTKRKSCNP